MPYAKPQLIDIYPANELHFEGPFTDVVVSTIKLSNPRDDSVCFKVKTTVPKRYCVRPSSGVLKPHSELTVSVMLQPFHYDPNEKTKHKFMIQSMVLPEGCDPFDNVWKDADPSKIMDSKLICILRMPGELVVEPSHELVFEGPFKQPVQSVIKLRNPSTVPICFKLQASSECLSASKTAGYIEPNEQITVNVLTEPFEYDPNEKPRHRILIKSAVAKDSTDRACVQLPDDGSTMSTLLKCVYTLPELDEKIKPTKQGYSLTSAPESAAPKVDVDALLTEVTALRRENAVLKEADILLRRTALSGTCLTSAEGGGAVVGRTGVIGAITSAPPILYLILALLIGLVLGKFIS